MDASKTAPNEADFYLPFRQLAFIFSATLLFAAGLDILWRCGIDTSALLDIKVDEYVGPRLLSSADVTSLSGSRNGVHPVYVHPKELSKGIYGLALTGLAWTVTSWLIMNFAYSATSTASLVQIGFLSLSLLIPIVVLLVPSEKLWPHHRALFITRFARTVVGRFVGLTPFSDILLADIMTSLTRTFVDAFITSCVLWNAPSIASYAPDLCRSSAIVPLVGSVPYLIRLRHCLAEVAALWGTSPATRSALNALKYSSTFPVLFIGSAIQWATSARNVMFQLWLFFAFLNAGYSAWWDITNDWGFSVFTTGGVFSSFASNKGNRTPAVEMIPLDTKQKEPQAKDEISAGSSSTSTSPAPRESKQPSNQFSLSKHTDHYADQYIRPKRLLGPPWLYYAVIVVNIFLRFSWIIRLRTVNRDGFWLELHDTDRLIVLIQILELARRSIWTIFRMEWQAVSKSYPGSYPLFVESQ